MTRSLAAAAFCVAVLAPLSAQETPLSVNQIVQKHIEALGGSAKLKAIQTLTLTGKASLMDGQVEAPISIKVKRPGSMRLEISVQGQSFIQSFDGATAWMVNPFNGAPEPQKMNEEDTAASREDSDFIDGALVDYQAKGHTVELAGKEDVNGNPTYRLKVLKKGGAVEYEFVDAKTFLVVKVTGKRHQQGEDIEFESITTNYKPVNDVMMPFSVNQRANGRSIMDFTIQKIEPNTPLDDSIFRFPEKPKEAK